MRIVYPVDYLQSLLLQLLEYSFYFQNKGVFNWTATYRSDSTIVAPYERWTYYNENVKVQTQLKQYAANKTRQVINNRIYEWLFFSFHPEGNASTKSAIVISVEMASSQESLKALFDFVKGKGGRKDQFSRNLSLFLDR